MDQLWTWKGDYFGYREADDLRTHSGVHAGVFVGDEIYAPDGRYLGELRSGRLITHKQSRSKRIARVHKNPKKMGIVKSVGYVGYVNIVGYEDFPAPDRFS